MQKTIDFLYRLKQANDEMGNYEAFNLYEAIEELESLQKRKCSNCRFSYRLRSGLFDCDKIQKLDLHKDFCCNKWVEK